MFGLGKRFATLVALAATLTAAGCGGGDDASSIDPIAWPEKWCNVKVGDTPERAIELMGEPTTDHRESSGSMSWDWREYQFNLFLGADDRIRQLDTNDIMMSKEQKAAMRCGPIRTADDPSGFDNPTYAEQGYP